MKSITSIGYFSKYLTKGGYIVTSAPQEIKESFFIFKANLKHDKKYNYNFVSYKNAKSKVAISCKNHGIFQQTPNDHLTGYGCKKCGIESRSNARRSDTKTFIRDAQIVHGKNTYIYDQVDYINSTYKIIILCPIHGIFKQAPASHLIGRKCPECAKIENSKKRTKSTVAFIREAKLIHGNTYDYSLCKYFGCDKKVRIECKKHGIFTKIATRHLNGEGCSICARNEGNINRRVSQKEFLEISNINHGKKYDYSLAIYTTSKLKVKIICPSHGVFEQAAGRHMNGAGCKKCAADLLSTEKRFSKADWIVRCEYQHGKKYNYSKSKYRGSTSKIIIKCPKHGDFSQLASSHSQGYGCPKCHGRKSPKEHINDFKRIHSGKPYSYDKTKYLNYYKKLTVTCNTHGDFHPMAGKFKAGHGCPKCSGNTKDTLLFVKQARAVHGDKYDYRKTVYKGCKSKVTIICPAHGEFKQRPSDHTLGKHGCQDCSLSGFKNSKPATVYILNHQNRYMKIGISNKPNQRMKQLKLATPFSFSVKKFYSLKNGFTARAIERHLLAENESANFFDFDGSTEWVVYDIKILRRVRKLIEWYSFLDNDD